MWTAHSYSYRRLVEFVKRTVPPEQLDTEITRLNDLAFEFLDTFTARVSTE